MILRMNIGVLGELFDAMALEGTIHATLEHICTPPAQRMRSYGMAGYFVYWSTAMLGSLLSMAAGSAFLPTHLRVFSFT